jgi:hypothetical protein
MLLIPKGVQDLEWITGNLKSRVFLKSDVSCEVGRRFTSAVVRRKGG